MGTHCCCSHSTMRASTIIAFLGLIAFASASWSGLLTYSDATCTNNVIAIYTSQTDACTTTGTCTAAGNISIKTGSCSANLPAQNDNTLRIGVYSNSDCSTDGNGNVITEITVGSNRCAQTATGSQYATCSGGNYALYLCTDDNCKTCTSANSGKTTKCTSSAGVSVSATCDGSSAATIAISSLLVVLVLVASL